MFPGRLRSCSFITFVRRLSRKQNWAVCLFFVNETFSLSSDFLLDWRGVSSAFTGRRAFSYCCYSVSEGMATDARNETWLVMSSMFCFVIVLILLYYYYFYRIECNKTKAQLRAKVVFIVHIQSALYYHWETLRRIFW